jgi:hypothetical protein
LIYEKRKLHTKHIRNENKLQVVVSHVIANDTHLVFIKIILFQTVTVGECNKSGKGGGGRKIHTIQLHTQFCSMLSQI